MADNLLGPARGTPFSLERPDSLLEDGPSGLMIDDDMDYEGRAHKIGKTVAESGKVNRKGVWKSGVRGVGRHGAKSLARSAGFGGMIDEIDKIMGKKPKAEASSKPKKSKPKKAKTAKASAKPKAPKAAKPKKAKTAKAAKTAKKTVSRSNTDVMAAAKGGLRELESMLDGALAKGEKKLLRDIGRVKINRCK